MGQMVQLLRFKFGTLVLLVAAPSFLFFVRPYTKYRSNLGVELQDSLCPAVYLSVSILRPVIGRRGSVW